MVMEMGRKLTRWTVLGALLLMVVPGPALALCTSELAAGCCCSPKGCSTEPPRQEDASAGCCSPQDPAPDTPVTVPVSASPQLESAPAELTDGETLTDPTGPRANRGCARAPDSPPVALFTLHAAYLI